MLIKKIMFFILIISLIQISNSLEITREFSSNNVDINENIIVKLIVKISPEDEVYVIEEDVPDALTILETNEGSYAKGKILWVVKEDIRDTELSYKLKGGYGSDYFFKGVFSVNGQPEKKILGESILVIQGPPSGHLCGNGKCDSGEECSNCPSDCGDCPVSGVSGGGGGGGKTSTNSNDKETSEISKVSEKKSEKEIQQETFETKSFDDFNENPEEKSISKIWLAYFLIISVLIIIALILFYILKKRNQKNKY